ESKPITDTSVVEQRYGLPAIRAKVLDHLADIYTVQQKYVQAEALLQQALEMNRQLGKTDQEALNLFSLGNLMREKENYKQAIAYLEKALTLYKKMQVKEQVCGVFIALARVYIQLGQLETANELIKKGETLAKTYDLKTSQINALEVLKDIYTQQKNYKQALAAQKEIVKLKEAVLDEQKVKEIENLRIAHEAEQKEQAIVLLEKEKSLQALQVEEQTNLAKYNQARLTLLFKEKLLQTRTFAQTRKENEQVLARTVYEKKQETQRYQAEQQRKQLLEKESQLKATALTTSKLRRRNFILIGGAVILLILIVGGWLLKNQQQRIQLAKEKAQRQQLVVQFDRLKNQVQPHFLFNSLQALASLIPQDTQKAHQFTTAFSQLYQLVLTFNNDVLISLREEVDFCKTYLTVQKIRFEEYLQVDWQLSTDALEARIPPLALQLTLENAIKHNEISAAHPLKVDVYEEAGKLVVKNSLKVTDRNVASTHIGVKNIMERYELLSTATPTFTQTDQYYITKLPLV
ncbi:MAG: histidine kinase, partial [Bacteroidota bacterium]